MPETVQRLRMDSGFSLPTSSLLPGPESHSGMQFRLMPLGADTFLANVGIFAPAAPGQLCLLPDGPADGAGFQHVGNHVPGVTSPGFQDFAFFPNLFKFVVAKHNLFPRSADLAATWGPSLLPLAYLLSAGRKTALDSVY